jgi:hypothetical protein
MATILPNFGEVSFDPETLRIMGEAFDKACGALNWTQRPPILNEGLANRIIEFAQAGERDSDRLCRRALRVFGIIRPVEVGPPPTIRSKAHGNAEGFTPSSRWRRSNADRPSRLATITSGRRPASGTT